MNRQARRQVRKQAMEHTIREIQSEWRVLTSQMEYDQDLSAKLYHQQTWLAREIAEANYTQDNANKDAKELERALQDINNCYARNVVKHMAWSRRYWHIACYEEMWSL